jgi:hypothetical protein
MRHAFESQVEINSFLGVITQIRIFKEQRTQFSLRRVRPRMHRVVPMRCMRGVTLDAACRVKMETWWSQPGSNRRPPACKAGALPAELWPLCSGRLPGLVGLGRVELPTSPLSGVRSNQLSYRPGYIARLVQPHGHLNR